MVALNKLGKVWFQSTFLVNFHGCFVRNLKSLRPLFLKEFRILASNVWAWIENLKYYIWTPQNQKGANEK